MSENTVVKNTGAVLGVIVAHLALLWGLTQLEHEPFLFDEVGGLEMIEVALGVPAPEPEIEQLPEPEPEPEPVKETMITAEPEPQSPPDVVKASDPEPEPPKPEPPKPEPVKPKKPKPKPKVAKKAAPPQPIGDPNGSPTSTSTQGNASVSAALGAGFGRAMQGRCSDRSNDAEDAGTVGLLVQIAENGKATQVSITRSSGIKRLDSQATRMAQGHTYSPAKQNGKPVSGSVTFNIVFKCGGV